MSEIRAEGAGEETAGPPRGRAGRRLVLALVAVPAALLALLLVALGPGSAIWTLRATLAGSSDESAWAHVPTGHPVLVACDVPTILDSAIAKALRPQLDDLAARHGFDTTLAEANVRHLIVAADGPDYGFGVASGFRLSPLLLARFAQPWTLASVDGRRAASDGETLLVPLEPGIVAWVPAGVDPERVAAALSTAESAPAEPLALEGSALRARLRFDDRLRPRALQELPSEAATFVASLEGVDARVSAGEELELRLDLSHRDAASATRTAALLVQANTAATLMRGAGSFAALLGPDAALLALLPPLAVSQDGTSVLVEASASAELASKWLVEIERRFSR